MRKSGSKRTMLRRSGTGRLRIAGIIALLLAVLAIYRHDTRRDHYLTGKVSATLDWRTNCRAHGFSSFNRPRKVFDLVLFSTELDWLEIRLHSHAPYVDYFVIVESPTTFTNKPKPLHLKDNWERYKAYHHQIIYKVVHDPIVSARHWDHEDYFRNSLLYEVFPGLPEGQAAHKNDVLIVSDMDELLKPDALLLLRNCAIPKRLTLRTDLYYYSFQWLHRGEQWAHPQATIFAGSINSTIAPNNLRMNLLGPGLPPFASLSRWWDQATLWNAGWHCSSCFSTVREMQTKMHSFSHQGWNTQENRDVQNMIYRVRNGLDLFSRPDEVYDKVKGNDDVPQYVRDEFERAGRFKYLLDRDGDNAAFEDLVMTPSLKG